MGHEVAGGLRLLQQRLRGLRRRGHPHARGSEPDGRVEGCTARGKNASSRPAGKRNEREASDRPPHQKYRRRTPATSSFWRSCPRRLSISCLRRRRQKVSPMRNLIVDAHLQTLQDFDAHPHIQAYLRLLESTPPSAFTPLPSLQAYILKIERNQGLPLAPCPGTPSQIISGLAGSLDAARLTRPNRKRRNIVLVPLCEYIKARRCPPITGMVSSAIGPIKKPVELFLFAANPPLQSISKDLHLVTPHFNN